MPIKTPGGILEVEDAKLRASYLLANTSVGIGTSTTVPDGASLYIDEDNPTIRFQEGTTTSAARILAKSGTLRLESGTDYDQPDLTGDIAFSNIQGGTTHMIIKGDGNVGIGTDSPSQMLDVSGNVQVGTANLFVDTTTGRVGVGVTDPGHNLDIVSEMNLRSVSNTASIKYDSNVVTEYVRSKKLIKYPRVKMTAATTSGYTASASSDLTNWNPWKAFNGVIGDVNHQGWHSASSTYNTTGTHAGSGSITDYQGTQIDGEWIKIQLPDKIRLQKMRLIHRAGLPIRSPRDATLLGSTNGSTWYPLISWDSDTFRDYVWNEYEINTQEYYDYYVLVVEKIQSDTNSDSVQIHEIEYYGIPEYDPDAHGTDAIVRSVPNVPNTDWLQVYWDAKGLSDGSISTVNDLKPSGTAVNGTTSGGVTVSNGAFTLDGVDDYIRGTVPGVSGDYIHSVSLWIKPINTEGLIFEISGSTRAANSVIGLYLDGDGTLAYYFYNNDARYYTNLQIDEWYHIGLTYHGNGERRIYVNGIQPPFKRKYGTLSNPLTLTGGTLTIGNRVGLNANYFNGSVANFRLFNRTLAAEEIWQLYAYEKEYFQVSPDVLTFKGGRLGIGTSEPRAVLDVRGDIIMSGKGVPSVYSRGSWNSGTSATFDLDYNNYIFHRIIVKYYGRTDAIYRSKSRVRFKFVGETSFASSGYESMTWYTRVDGNTGFLSNWNDSDGSPLSHYDDQDQDTLAIIDVANTLYQRGQLQFKSSWTWGGIGYTTAIGGCHRNGGGIIDAVKIYLEDYDSGNIVNTSAGEYVIIGYK